MQTSDTSNALSAEVLVTITPAALIVIILEQQKLIGSLSIEVARLKGQRETDSKTSAYVRLNNSMGFAIMTTGYVICSWPLP